MNPLLTKHAYTRYRERWGVPYASNAEIEKAILTPFAVSWIEGGATRLLQGDQQLCIAGGRVTTVVKRKNPSKGFTGREYELEPSID